MILISTEGEWEMERKNFLKLFSVLYVFAAFLILSAAAPVLALAIGETQEQTENIDEILSQPAENQTETTNEDEGKPISVTPIIDPVLLEPPSPQINNTVKNEPQNLSTEQPPASPIQNNPPVNSQKNLNYSKTPEPAPAVDTEKNDEQKKQVEKNTAPVLEKGTNLEEKPQEGALIFTISLLALAGVLMFRQIKDSLLLKKLTKQVY